MIFGEGKSKLGFEKLESIKIKDEKLKMKNQNWVNSNSKKFKCKMLFIIQEPACSSSRFKNRIDEAFKDDVRKFGEQPEEEENKSDP